MDDFDKSLQIFYTNCTSICPYLLEVYVCIYIYIYIYRERERERERERDVCLFILLDALPGLASFIIFVHRPFVGGGGSDGSVDVMYIQTA